MSGSAGAADASAPMRFVWHSRFGDVVIEVRGGLAYVNGRPVEPIARDVDTAQPASTETPAAAGPLRR